MIQSLPATPFYIYDEQNIVAQCNALTKVCLNGVSTALYSLKANPNPALVNTIVKQGLGCDVSSAFELSIALESGISPHNIGCVGPYKCDELLTGSLQNNIAFIAVESLQELYDIQRLKRDIHSDTALILRINPDIKISGGSMKMGGAPSQFGFSETDIPTAMAVAKKCGLTISGIHIYATTRVLDADSLLANITRVGEHMLALKKQYQLNTDILNLGGGFGIPYYRGESELNLSSIESALLEMQFSLAKIAAAERIFFESGRFIVGPSGRAIVQVKNIKQSGDKYFAICDGGYNIFQGATAFGNLMRKPYMLEKVDARLRPMQNLSAAASEAPLYTLVGPLCTPSDIIADKFPCPQLSVGDFIAINNVGAYSITCSPGLFIGHGFPGEYLASGKQLREIGTPDSTAVLKGRYQVKQPDNISKPETIPSHHPAVIA